MYEHLVKNVRQVRTSPDKRPDAITLLFDYADSESNGSRAIPLVFAPEQIGAIETWLAQPKPPTPEDRARDLMRKLDLDSFHPKRYEDIREGISIAIREAIEADRAARGET